MVVVSFRDSRIGCTELARLSSSEEGSRDLLRITEAECRQKQYIDEILLIHLRRAVEVPGLHGQAPPEVSETRADFS